MADPDTTTDTTTATDYRPLGVVGTALALFGGVLVAVAYIGLDWLEPTSLSIDFPQLHHAAAAAGTRALGAAYFGWLAWVLLAACLLLALAANVPGALARPAGLLGTVAGLAAAVVTVFALRLSSATSLGDYVSNAGAGYWAAIAGFVALAAGAAAGVIRRIPPPLP